jgi:hypothetical protein
MLSLEIEGAWEPQDFIELLRSIESFYYKLALRDTPWVDRVLDWIDDEYKWERWRYDRIPFEVTLDQINQRILDQSRYETPFYRRLKVKRIKYASPGGIDLLGIGKVFETICNSVGRIKSYFDEANLRKERDEQARLDTELKRVQLEKERVQLEKERVQLEKERENLQSLKIMNAVDALKLIGAQPRLRGMLLPLLVRDQDPLANLISEGKLIAARTTASRRKVG